MFDHSNNDNQITALRPRVADESYSADNADDELEGGLS